MNSPSGINVHFFKMNSLEIIFSRRTKDRLVSIGQENPVIFILCASLQSTDDNPIYHEHP